MSSEHPLEKLRHLLPPSIQELMGVISLDAVVIIVKNYGGTRATVPYRPYPEHTLWRQIGEEEFKKLCARYKGETLSIARCARAMQAVRNAGILQDARAGSSLAQLALKNKMTERGISKVLRQMEKHEYQPWVKQVAGWRQGDLFD